MGRQLRLCQRGLKDLAAFYHFKLVGANQPGFGPAALYAQLEIERLFAALQFDLIAWKVS